MKKTLAMILAALMAVSISACGTQEAAEPAEPAEEIAEAEAVTEATPEEESVISSMGNPVQEMSEEELTQASNVDLPAPEGAENPVWAAITDSDGNVLAQLTYLQDGESYCLRAMMTGITSLAPSALPESAEDTVGFDPEHGNLSGIYSVWTSCVESDVQGRTAFCYLAAEDGNGYIAWLDVVPGVLYNLSMLEGTDADTLTAAANSVFVPMQGEA